MVFDVGFNNTMPLRGMMHTHMLITTMEFDADQGVAQGYSLDGQLVTGITIGLSTYRALRIKKGAIVFSPHQSVKFHHRRRHSCRSPFVGEVLLAEVALESDSACAVGWNFLAVYNNMAERRGLPNLANSEDIPQLPPLGGTTPDTQATVGAR